MDISTRENSVKEQTKFNSFYERIEYQKASMRYAVNKIAVELPQGFEDKN
jgi:hypothetical protein